MFKIVSRGIHWTYFTFYMSDMYRGAPITPVEFWDLSDAKAFIEDAKAQKWGKDRDGTPNLYIMKESQIVK